MKIALSPIDPATDREDLVEFLSSNVFPFHVVARPTKADADARISRDAFTGPDNAAFWVEIADDQRAGFIVFEEVTDGTPLIDLRIAEQWRGLGVGTAALELGTATIFDTYPSIQRIEGNTRSDNSGMRRAFASSGYVKEAHYRDGWTVADAAPMDAVAYAILRKDWLSGTTTPVKWES